MYDKIASINKSIEKFRPRDPNKSSSLAVELQHVEAQLAESRFCLY